MSLQGPLLRQTYLLRIWEEPDSTKDRRVLRFLLQEVYSGRRTGFGSLDGLFAYLAAHHAIDPREGGQRQGSLAGQEGDDPSVASLH